MLLHELAGVQGMTEPMLSAQAMPLLHSLSSGHAYITMFTHVCRVGQVSGCLDETLFCIFTSTSLFVYAWPELSWTVAINRLSNPMTWVCDPLNDDHARMFAVDPVGALLAVRS